MRAIFYLLMITSTLVGKPFLTDYGTNVYSQFGEDGIINKIFDTIGTSTKIAIEFGATDGFILSNTAQLWTKDASWKAYLIESDATSFNALKKNIVGYPCIALHRKIGISPTDSLEAVLAPYNLPPSIDLLSIDIDGDDYHVFNSLNTLHPRVIICEYNPTIPSHLDVYADYGNHLGCSVAALQRLAKEKGYSLVAITVSNCIFVQDEEFALFDDFETDITKLSMNRCLRYLITDYTGNYQIIGPSDFADPYGVKKPTDQSIRGDITLLPSLQY